MNRLLAARLASVSRSSPVTSVAPSAGCSAKAAPSSRTPSSSLQTRRRIRSRDHDRDQRLLAGSKARLLCGHALGWRRRREPDQPIELAAQRRSIGNPPRRLLLQHPLQELPDRSGHPRTEQPERHRFSEQDAHQHRGEVLGSERRPPDQALIQDTSQHEHIRGRRDVPEPAHLLRCPVLRSPHRDPCPRERRSPRPTLRDPKIQDLAPPDVGLGKEQVGRLQVAVQDEERGPPRRPSAGACSPVGALRRSRRGNAVKRWAGSSVAATPAIARALAGRPAAHPAPVLRGGSSCCEAGHGVLGRPSRTSRRFPAYRDVFRRKPSDRVPMTATSSLPSAAGRSVTPRSTGVPSPEDSGTE